jgi:hypothetical protein
MTQKRHKLHSHAERGNEKNPTQSGIFFSGNRLITTNYNADHPFSLFGIQQNEKKKSEIN